VSRARQYFRGGPKASAIKSESEIIGDELRIMSRYLEISRCDVACNAGAAASTTIRWGLSRSRDNGPKYESGILKTDFTPDSHFCPGCWCIWDRYPPRGEERGEAPAAAGESQAFKRCTCGRLMRITRFASVGQRSEWRDNWALLVSRHRWLHFSRCAHAKLAPFPRKQIKKIGIGTTGQVNRTSRKRAEYTPCLIAR